MLVGQVQQDGAAGLTSGAKAAFNRIVCNGLVGVRSSTPAEGAVTPMTSPGTMGGGMRSADMGAIITRSSRRMRPALETNCTKKR